MSHSLFLCWFGSLVICGLSLASIVQGAELDGRQLTFNRDIRPILSDHCFACHGPDKTARQADLRLDDRESAMAIKAVVPGDANASTLVARILSEDPDEVMPPPKTNKPLRDVDKQKLIAWIQAGAPYEKHWAYIPVPAHTPVPSPAEGSTWGRNTIDLFVLEQLQAAGHLPAPPASRETWLRRVTFDLTGLPPTLAELDAFLSDARPDAEERVVDRLLQTPTYGERMANDWLDVARYADTYGYQADRDMHVSPWRDWCIRVFNQNLPYDQFITWQTAGDLLPHATTDQRLATAFNRLHRQTNEGGSIEQEFRVAYVADRVVTNGTAFLGLTLECARCHDHKFDPVTQRDFYSLASFFANIDEHGLYSHFTETAPTPSMLLYGSQDIEANHARLLALIAEQRQRLATIRAAARDRFSATPTKSFSIDKPTLQPVSRFSFEDVAAAADYHPVPGKVGNGLTFTGDGAFVCSGAGAFDRTTPFSISLWVKPADHGARRVILHRCVAAEDAAFRGYSLVADQGHVVFSLIHFWPGNAIQVETESTLPIGEWTHLTLTYDGSSQAAGTHIYWNGQPAPIHANRDQLTRDFTYRGEWGDSGGAELSLGARFRDVGFAGGSVDELQIYDRELRGAEVAMLADLAPTEEQQVDFLLTRDPEYQSAIQSLRQLIKEENQLSAGVRQIMVLSDAKVSRPVHILRRGAYDAPGEEVQANAPASILPFSPDLPRNRLGLAQWMTDPQNPLVSRVAVNRVWNLFFGRGLVTSLGDFGSQGQPPTHPLLLDWLSRDFMDSGWNVKRLCKQIVLSATYRQSSQPRDLRLLTDDPENRLLARGPRHRWSAEQLRDNALAVSGLLSYSIGGPSVFPYQPAGLWEESGTGRSYTPSQGANLYRRSLYTFWRRTSPPPTMTAFDATSREVCVARRERTATPLQALVLQNDPQFVEAARVLAVQLIHEFGDEKPQRIDAAFRMLTSRHPNSREQSVLMDLYAEQLSYFTNNPGQAQEFVTVGNSPAAVDVNLADQAATAVVVQAMMNLDECVTKR